jgi:antitoxin component YwqK of YwqJK toxin-antitoxin module
MASCTFCKGDETEDNLMYKKPEDCLCNPNLHQSCLYKINKLLTSDQRYKAQIEQYVHEKYNLCRTCKNKYGTNTTTIDNKTYSLQEISQISIHGMNLKFTITDSKSTDKYLHYQTYQFNFQLKLDPVLILSSYYNNNRNAHGETLVYYDIYPYNLKEKYTSNIGSRHGTTTEYYFNGKIKSIQNHINGSLEGKLITYFCNDTSTIHSEKTYRDNQLNGYMKNYYETGTLLNEIYHTNDYISYVQPYRTYYMDGTLLIEIVAIMRLDHDNGTPRQYELVNYKEYNFNGTIKSESKKYYRLHSSGHNFVDYDIPIMKYHENGKLKERKTFVDPADTNEDINKIIANPTLIRDGFNKLVLVETFYATGAKHERYTIKHDPCGTLEGSHITWHSDGKYKKICEYHNSQPIHQCGSWDSTGLLQSYGYYNSDGIYKPIGLGI